MKGFLKEKFYFKPILRSCCIVRFFALADRPCQLWTEVIFRRLSLLFFGLWLRPEARRGGGGQAIAGGIAAIRSS